MGQAASSEGGALIRAVQTSDQEGVRRVRGGRSGHNRGFIKITKPTMLILVSHISGPKRSPKCGPPHHILEAQDAPHAQQAHGVLQMIVMTWSGYVLQKM